MTHATTVSVISLLLTHNLPQLRTQLLKKHTACKHGGQSRVQFPVRGKTLLSTQKFPYHFWGPPSILLNGYQGSFPPHTIPP